MRTVRWIGAASLICAVGGCATAGSRAEPDLTVLVYNIHAGKDAKGVDNLERVAGIIRDSRADIVLLQEVDKNTERSGRVDQLARIRELTGMSGAFGKTLDYQGGDYGIAILSRWQIASDTLVHLPVHPAQLRSGVSYEPRGALVVTLSSPLGKLRVVNTHLDASRADSFRIQEVATVIAVAEAESLPDANAIVGGDFNSEPESAVHASMITAGWRDGFAECGKGSGLSYPDGVPVKRIDYLFMNGASRCRSAEVLDTRASDHRPVLFRIMLQRPR